MIWKLWKMPFEALTMSLLLMAAEKLVSMWRFLWYWQRNPLWSNMQFLDQNTLQEVKECIAVKGCAISVRECTTINGCAKLCKLNLHVWCTKPNLYNKLLVCRPALYWIQTSKVRRQEYHVVANLLLLQGGAQPWMLSQNWSCTHPCGDAVCNSC